MILVEYWNSILTRAALGLILPIVGSLSWSSSVLAQTELIRPPINYYKTKPVDPVARLAEKIKSGDTRLKWDKQHGWLPSLMEALQVDRESQNLVFSKTSLQSRHINPSNPRALYFNDHVYLGSVPGGDLIEITAIDPVLGPVFYSLEQKPTQSSALPLIERDQNRCLTCHATSKTQGVPGFLVRSVYPSRSGHPHYGLGTITTDHRTPFKDRFGGWYVTGTHGEMRHRGNSFARNDPRNPIDREPGANLKSLPKQVNPEKYLANSSDLVALMLLEYQSQFHNALTLANYETRRALHHQKVMNDALKRPTDYESDSTRRRIRKAGENLLEAIFFCDEFELKSPVKGSTEFARSFQKKGPFDAQGRSLRQFDLKNRLFRYRCSFFIYSDSYEALPKRMLNFVERRICEILTGKDQSGNFSHLSESERKAIVEILIATKPRLARMLRAPQEAP